MKKSLLSVGAVSMALAMIVAGCSSFEQQDPSAYLKKLDTFMGKAQGLEKHKRQPDQFVLPNALLSSSAVYYQSVVGGALDAIELRYGKADELYVAKVATDPNYKDEWKALRNSDKEPEKAKSAEATLKKVIKDAYATYKTRNKKSVDELYNSVIGAVAQSDYVYYKQLVKDGKADKKIFTELKTWCELGAKNVKRVSAEEAKVVAERQKKIEAAKKVAEADNRKIELIVKYYGSKAALPGIRFGVDQMKKALPAQVAGIAAPILEAALINTMVKNMNDAAKEWPGVTTAIADAIPPFKMPAFSAAGINLFNAKAKVDAYLIEVNKSLSAWQEKAFGPYSYSLKIAGKRFGYTFKAWAWQWESYQAYKEASAE